MATMKAKTAGTEETAELVLGTGVPFEVVGVVEAAVVPPPDIVEEVAVPQGPGVVKLPCTQWTEGADAAAVKW